MKTNTIIHGDALTELKKFDDECIDMCITSPPYWSLRDYGESVKAIWDGDENCTHEWGDKIKKQRHKKGETNPGKEAWYKDKDAISGDAGNFCSLCGAWRGQLGLEPTFELYIKHLCDIFDEVKRVLKNTGTCWVNLGDSYSNSGDSTQPAHKQFGRNDIAIATHGHKADLPSKSLCCIPDRFKIEMVNRGWILRNTIIWAKPNCMPSSAKDRFTVDFEYLFFFVKSSETQYWVHIRKLLAVIQKPKPDCRWQHATGYELKKPPKEKDWDRKRIVCPDCKETGRVTIVEDLPLFGLTKLGKIACKRCYESTQNKDVENYTVKEWQKINLWEGRDYWFEQQFDEYTEALNRWGGPEIRNSSHKYIEMGGHDGKQKFGATSMFRKGQPVRPDELGRNKRCVWQIPTQPYSEAHFAVFPEALIETPIKAGCPQYICKKCGVAREKILKPTERYAKILGKGFHDHKDDMGKGMLASVKCYGSEDKIHDMARAGMDHAEYKCVGYTDCGCNAGWHSGVLLDPFMGAGTSGVVARKLGRDFIGIELQKKYIPMAHKRIMAVPESLFRES